MSTPTLGDKQQRRKLTARNHQARVVAQIAAHEAEPQFAIFRPALEGGCGLLPVDYGGARLVRRPEPAA